MDIIYPGTDMLIVVAIILYGGMNVIYGGTNINR